MLLSSLYQQKTIKNYLNFSAKGLKDQSIGMNIKKCENKYRTIKYRYFLESDFARVNRLFLLIYPNQSNIVIRFSAKRYYLQGSNSIFHN